MNKAITLFASAAVTASTNGTVTSDVADFTTLDVQVACTAFTGAPTFSAQLQTSFDNGTTWTNVGAAISVSATGRTLNSFTGFGPLIRVAFTVTGGTTPSVTVEVKAVAKH